MLRSSNVVPTPTLKIAVKDPQSRKTGLWRRVLAAAYVVKSVNSNKQSNLSLHRQVVLVLGYLGLVTFRIIPDCCNKVSTQASHESTTSTTLGQCDVSRPAHSATASTAISKASTSSALIPNRRKPLK